MRDITLGKPMETHRHDKHSGKKPHLSPLLVCWLIAVGLMMLVSSHSPSSARPSTSAPLMDTTSEPEL